MKKSLIPYDCAIVGGGPAGVSAALHLWRMGFVPAVFEKDEIGGQMRVANSIKNYPGFPHGINGKEVAACMSGQISNLCIRTIKAEVVELSGESFKFRIKTKCAICEARSIIIACGLKPKRPCVKGERSLIGKKIFPYCDLDGFDVDAKEIAVVGSGDSAFDLAVGFAQRGAKPCIVMRGKAPKCNPHLLAEAKGLGVDIRREAGVVSFHEKDRRLVLELALPAGHEGAVFDYAVTAIGKEPCYDFLPRAFRLKKVDGLFWAGDCEAGRQTHVASAVGSGALAAMRAAEFLKRIGTGGENR